MRMKTKGLLAIAAALYGASVIGLVQAGRPLDEVVAVLLIFGLGLSGLAWMLTRRLPAAPPQPAWQTGEAGLLALCLLFVMLMLGCKGAWLDALAGDRPQARAIADLLLKLASFVGLPLLLYRWGLGWRPAALGLRLPSRPSVRLNLAGIGMAAAGIAVQLLLGHGADPLWQGEFTVRQRLIGIALQLPWLLLEVGLVEEFFFRALLQGRITRATGSAAAGIAVSALAFGLAHAPGLWLRGAGAADALGTAPGPLLAVAYSIATMSLAGVFLGVLWARSGSLWLVMLVHVAIDALPNAPDFIRLWSL